MTAAAIAGGRGDCGLGITAGVKGTGRGGTGAEGQSEGGGGKRGPLRGRYG